MALKRKITKAEFDKLAKELQAEYKADGDDYVLNVDGLDDPDELRRARDREKEDAKALKKQLKEVTDKLAELEGSDDRKKGDIDKIDNAWKAKMEKQEKEASERTARNQDFIRKNLIGATADRIAAEISTMPTIMARTIRDRLSVNFDGDEPTLVILGSDGEPDKKATLDGLKKEFLTNKEFAPILIGSKASGGGAPQGKSDSKPGSTGAPDGSKPLELHKLPPKDLAAHLRAQKDAAT